MLYFLCGRINRFCSGPCCTLWFTLISIVCIVLFNIHISSVSWKSSPMIIRALKLLRDINLKLLEFDPFTICTSKHTHIFSILFDVLFYLCILIYRFWRNQIFHFKILLIGHCDQSLLHHFFQLHSVELDFFVSF